MRIQLSPFWPALAVMGVLVQSFPAAAQNYVPGDSYSSNGYSPPRAYGAPPAPQNYGAVPPPYERRPYSGQPYQGSVTYVPAGLAMHIRLATSISTDAASPGDLVEGTLDQPITLANGYIPAGVRVEGTITNAKAGGFLGRAGQCTIQFNRLIMPNGQQVPMSTHIIGEIGKYKENGNDSVAGEGIGTKVAQTAGRGVVGAGVGAALGTAVGAIAGGGEHRPWYRGGGTYAGQGAGRGAWSGAAIGGGLGVADGLLLRKGNNVKIPAGTTVQLQLDSPMQVAIYQAGAY